MNTTILPRIQTILADQLAIKESEADPAKTLAELGVDSLDFVEIIMAVEEEFNIEVSDEKAEQIKTVADLVAIVSP
jgi:acyl carrier protein